MPPRWTHITINCSDIDASVAFYTSFCGLTIVRDRRIEGRHNVWLGPATKQGEDPTFVLVMVQEEVKARIKIKNFFQEAGWRFFDFQSQKEG